MRWADIETAVYDNPGLRSADFHYVRDKMEAMFANLILRIKNEHAKFRTWVKTYGYSLDGMKFIKNLTEGSYGQLTGNYFAPIAGELLGARRVEVPTLVESEIVGLQEEIAELIDRTSDLYLKPGTKRERRAPNSTPVISEVKPSPSSGFDSKIVHDVSAIHRLFETKVSSLKLLFRASEHSFSIKDFHKKCDGQAGTVTIIETEFGKVIGGYTPIAWSSAKKQWAADKSLKSFIFSLNMREKFSLNLAQFAIANNPDKGPIFGCCDICIVDASNKERSNAEFPISYNNGKYIRSPESSFAFSGHPKGQFLIKEWEVFKIDFE